MNHTHDIQVSVTLRELVEQYLIYFLDKQKFRTCADIVTHNAYCIAMLQSDTLSGVC